MPKARRIRGGGAWGGRCDTPPPIFLGPPPVPMLPGGLPLAPFAAALAESAVALALAPVDTWKSRAQMSGIFPPAPRALRALAGRASEASGSLSAAAAHAAAVSAVNSVPPAPAAAPASVATAALAAYGKSHLAGNATRRRPPRHRPFRPYRGVLVSVFGAALDSLIFMSVYRFLRRSLAPRVAGAKERQRQRISSPPSINETGTATNMWPASLLAGAGASVFTALMSAPVDLIRERLRNGLHRSPTAALRAAISGPKQWQGLYVGVIPTICRDLPFETLEFAVFESLRRWMRKKRPANTPLTARDNLFLGVMTGALVGAAVAPLDLVVTRVLVNPTRYSGLVASVRTIAREEGFRGLFAGSLQKLSREAAASGLFFTCYEGALAKLGVSDDDD